MRATRLFVCYNDNKESEATKRRMTATIAIIIPPDFVSDDERLVLDYLQDRVRGPAAWERVGRAFDRLDAALLVIDNTQTTFRQFYRQEIDQRLAQSYLDQLLALDDVVTASPALWASYAREIIGLLRQRAWVQAKLPESRLLVSYILYWWNSFARGYALEEEIFRDLRTSGISFWAHDLRDPDQRYTPADLIVSQLTARLKAAACRLSPKTGDDRLIDGQPTSIRYTNTSTVLSRNIASRIEVSMQREATYTTHKTSHANGGCCEQRMPAPAARLGGMSRVNRNHRTTPFFGFVLNKRLELGKRPAMHATAGCGLALDLGACANIGQVFQHQRGTRLGSSHDLFAEDVIGVPTKARLLVAYPLQVALGALAALLLQRSFQVEQLAFNRLPAALAQEVIVRRDGRTHQAQVNANDLISRCDVRRGDRDHNVQPPLAVAEDQIGGIGRIARIRCTVVGYIEANGLPPTDQRHAYRLAFPIHVVGVDVVARRARIRAGHTDLAALLMQRERTFDGFGGFYPRLHQQIRHQCRILRFERVVGRVVQLHPIRNLLRPTDRTHGIKHCGELAAGFGKLGRLCRRGRQFYTDSSLHMRITPYSERICQRTSLITAPNPNTDAVCTAVLPFPRTPKGGGSLGGF